VDLEPLTGGGGHGQRRSRLRVLGLLGVVLALTACASAPARYAGTHADPLPPSGAGVDLYLIRRGWHTDVGFPARSMQDTLPQVLEHFPEARFVLFGFGDRRYLRSAHHGPGTLLRALWPGDALILVTALTAPPEVAFGMAKVRRLEIPAARARAIQAFIARSIAQRQDGPSWIGAGPYAGSAYAASTARYSGLHTCNTWTAEALRAGELPIRSAGTVFAGQVWTQVAGLQPGAGLRP